MDVQAYLERIRYQGLLTPNAETLRELQTAHLFAVPFENLSIHAGEPIVLEPRALFEKIVERRRGGFCYELNGLFGVLLQALGFEVTMLSAGVANAAEGFGPNFDHMALLVELDERWLVDVGFGDSVREPLLLDSRDEQRKGREVYRLTDDGHFLTFMQRKDLGQSPPDWKPQYRFTLAPRRFSDYGEMCLYHQTSPQSHFTKGRVCTRATPNGRVTLSEMRFITTTLDGGRDERELSSEAEHALMLGEHFGIVMR